MIEDMNKLNLLRYIERNVKVTIREFGENELRLNPPAQIGDLIHKTSYLHALILPSYCRLILLHLKGRWFRAIAFFEDHTSYVNF